MTYRDISLHHIYLMHVFLVLVKKHYVPNYFSVVGDVTETSLRSEIKTENDEISVGDQDIYGIDNPALVTEIEESRSIEMRNVSTIKQPLKFLEGVGFHCSFPVKIC